VNLAYRNVGDMTDEVQGVIQNRSLTKKDKIHKAFNRFYQDAWSAYDWRQLETHVELGLRKYDDTLADLEAAQGHFPLPFNCEIVKQIQLYDPTAGPLAERSMAEIAKARGSKLGQQGRPCFWTQVGTTAQYRELSATGTCTALSSDSGNDSPVERVVRVKYVSSEGQAGMSFWEDLAGDFTTGIALSLPVLAGWNIQSVELPAGWVGDFTIEDGSGNELVKVQSGEAPVTTANNHYRRWARILGRVEPTPDADYKAVITYDRVPLGLMEDLDSPEIPVCGYLVDMAIARLLREDGRADEAPAFERTAEITLRRAAKASPDKNRGAIPRGRNILWATGIRQNSK